MKKAQGLSLNMMVIAAIALVVLLVTIAVFTGFIGDKAVPFFGKQTECGAQPDTKCIAQNEKCDGRIVSGLDCSDKNKVCCAG